jgi:hypothetical protein
MGRNNLLGNLFPAIAAMVLLTMAVLLLAGCVGSANTMGTTAAEAAGPKLPPLERSFYSR